MVMHASPKLLLYRTLASLACDCPQEALSGKMTQEPIEHLHEPFQGSALSCRLSEVDGKEKSHLNQDCGCFLDRDEAYS